MALPTTARRKYYNTTGDDYESNRYGGQHMDGYRELRNETLLSILTGSFPNQNLRILEIGCGTGLTLQFLGQASAEYRLFGMDLSETMIRQAAKKAPALRSQPRLMLGDADRLPFQDGIFDVVYATRFIHQFSHTAKQQLWREFQRVARVGGILVVEFYARPYHWLRYQLGGGAKGRSSEAYFSHFPTRREVLEVVGDDVQIYPLRLPGSRVLSRAFGEERMRHLTQTIGRAGGGVFLDEYFVVSRKL